jgi:pimeloyl-ACP methyl ester carboxylesterase
LLSPAGAHLPGDHAAEVLATFRMRGRPEGRRFLDKLYHRAPLYTRLVAHELPRWMGRAPVRDLLEHAHEIAFSTDELAKLAVPTVLSWGKSERLLPASGLAFLKAHLPPHVRVEEPHGVGHCPQLDDPRALARRLAAFLAEVGA